MRVCVCVCVYMYVSLYVCILYCIISTQRPFTYLPWAPQLLVSIIMYPLRFLGTEFCLVSSPAIWWRSVELSGQPSDAAYYLMPARETPKWECDRTDIHKVYIRR